jgi:hypothetical protein
MIVVKNAITQSKKIFKKCNGAAWEGYPHPKGMTDKEFYEMKLKEV